MDRLDGIRRRHEASLAATVGSFAQNVIFPWGQLVSLALRARVVREYLPDTPALARIY